MLLSQPYTLLLQTRVHVPSLAPRPVPGPEASPLCSAPCVFMSLYLLPIMRSLPFRRQEFVFRFAVLAPSPIYFHKAVCGNCVQL